MKIGVVVDAFAYGGLETHLADFAAHLRPAHELHLILGMRADLPRAAALADGRVLQVDMSPAQQAGGVVEGVEAIAEYCSRCGLDLLHLHPFFSAPMGALAATLAGLPFVATLHGPHSIRQSQIDGGMHLELLRDLVLAHAAHVFCVSEEVADEASRLQPSARIQLLRNSVDTLRMTPATACAGGDWALVGRLDGDKLPGYLHFLDLMSLARPLGRVRVFGRGESEQAIKDHVAQQGRADKISFEGFKPDLPLHVRRGFAGVAGMGRVLLETAALGLPFVLVGYDGTKGLVSADEVASLAARNYSGRGRPAIGSDRFARQLAALDEDAGRYLLHDWVRENADSAAVWSRYMELVSHVERPETPAVDWLARLREHPMADLGDDSWACADGHDQMRSPHLSGEDPAGAGDGSLAGDDLSPASRRQRRDRQRALAVKWVKPVLPDPAWRAAKTVFAKASRGIEGPRARRELQAILAKHADAKGFVIYPPTVDWRLPLFQRPHQLALSFAEKGFVFFFCTSNSHYDDVSGFVEVAPRVYVTNFPIHLKLVPDPIVLISLASTIDFLDIYSPSRLIYDYIDELEIYLDYSPTMVEQHHELIRRADLVTVTAEKLLQDVAASRKEGVVLSPNAVDYRHFSGTRSAGDASDVAGTLDPSRPVVGYYGALAEWFDYELVKYSTRRTGFQYLLIGLDYDGTVQRAGLDLYPDIHFIGPRDYRILPAYASLFDVATIPFSNNKITEATSPLKLYEYMAAGKPIVTTDLRECRRYQSVLIGRSREEFVEKLYAALELGDDPDYRAVLEREGRENTWSARVEQMLTCLGL